MKWPLSIVQSHAKIPYPIQLPPPSPAGVAAASRSRRRRRISDEMIASVAVVGHQNNPLYLQSFTNANDALKLHHIVHCSLDVIDERGFFCSSTILLSFTQSIDLDGKIDFWGKF
ncbi:hypothetical protein ZIOFF_020308 [Zingiber officinale]|uniref:Uncharacterized protein n=1 Tax=Zingiber officinale TaxID=94328 RepID=A0A8J5LIN0_ZINOF|nr:hypothetical protein ZIOFF_020308 [Zingiber officinale]